MHWQGRTNGAKDIRTILTNTSDGKNEILQREILQLIKEKLIYANSFLSNLANIPGSFVYVGQFKFKYSY